ncbi:MAG: 50S ribosomal protein L21 [Candidatus Methylomirabilia bacterium]
MEAVIAVGGKQYRVTPGQLLHFERLPGEPGSGVEFNSVLLVNRDGQVVAEPSALASARVLGEVVTQTRARKVTVIKFKRRKGYRRRRGHRQAVTGVRITKIEV